MSNLYQIWSTERRKGGDGAEGRRATRSTEAAGSSPATSLRNAKAKDKLQLAPAQDPEFQPVSQSSKFGSKKKGSPDLQLAPAIEPPVGQDQDEQQRSTEQNAEHVARQIEEELDGSRATGTSGTAEIPETDDVADDQVTHLDETAARPPPESTPDQAAVIEGAVLAQDPSQIRQQLLDEAVSATDVRPYEELTKPRRWIPISIAAIVLLAICALAVTLGVTLSSNTNKDNPSTATLSSEMPSVIPSMAPSEVPTVSGFSEIVDVIEDLFGTTIEDSSSPQFKAAQWMATVDDEAQGLAASDSDRFIQRYALVVFYYATGGENWTSQANFLSPSLHECDWYEAVSPNDFTILGLRGVVACTEGRRISGIEFVTNNMTGTLPMEIGALADLTFLILNQNFITGILPSTLFGIPNLQYLSLPYNDFSGSIPTEIGQFDTLLQLWLEQTSLTGPIPSELGRHTRLRALTLQEGALTGTIPETLYQLSDLTTISLSFNELRGTLPQFFNSTWTSVENFGVIGNQLTGFLPNDLDSLSALKVFSVMNNNFTGPFPQSVEGADSLASLDLSENELTGKLPNDLSRLSDLEIFSVRQNRLWGSVPASMGNLTSLLWLDLADNAFTGKIPPELGSLTNLVTVLFQENQFQGTVPESLRQWENLKILTLELNQLTGNISFLCDESNPSEPFSQNISNLNADCFEEIVCPCCHFCCYANDTCFVV